MKKIKEELKMLKDIVVTTVSYFTIGAIGVTLMAILVKYPILF